MPGPSGIRATRLFGLEELAPGRHIVRVAAGPRLDVVVLSLDAPPDYRTSVPGGGGFAKLRADNPNRYRIDHVVDGERRSLDLDPTRENFHCVQPLGPEGWLLVRTRARDEVDHNAHVYGPDGARVRSFNVGDGVEDVQATEDGRIWVSFFDEGVFGAATLGRAGAACLDVAGRVIFRFNDLAVAGSVPDIADCYAMNADSGREAWLCYYTDFPLVRVVDGAVADVWMGIPVKGSHAFAVRGRHVLFAGGYHMRNRLILVDLATSAVEERVPEDGAGNVLGPFSAIGRGRRLYLLASAGVFFVDS